MTDEEFDALTKDLTILYADQSTAPYQAVVADVVPQAGQSLTDAITQAAIEATGNADIHVMYSPEASRHRADTDEQGFWL